MKNLSGQQSLWLVFPILLVLIVLIAGIILFPTIQADIRGRASEPTPPPMTTSNSPEIICSELYNPVCGTNGQTYGTACEANLAGITDFTQGACRTPEALPATN
jgi:hypothetical protein